MKPSKRPNPLHSRHSPAAANRCARRRWRLAHEFEDEEEVILGPGNDRADAEDTG